MALTISDDMSIDIHAALGVFHYRSLAAFAILGAAGLASIGQWWPGIPPHQRFLLLIPQLSLLLLSAGVVINAIVTGVTPDLIVKSSIVIASNQAFRACFPVLYAAAIHVRIKG